MFSRPFPSGRRAAFWLSFAAPAIVLGACIASAPDGLHRQTDDPDAGAGGSFISDGSPPDDPDVKPSNDPHAVSGVTPSHGPFTGGDKVLVKGKGFTSKAKIWFGATLIDPSTVLPVDPTRVQVTVPPGVAGSVDVSVQNGDDASTKRTLQGGYAYDAVFAAPDSGPVPGGTVIEIVGQGTHFDKTTVALIDNKACTTLDVVSATLLDCTVPQGTPGSKSIRVTTGAETITVLDAYTYEDSTNGYKGGLSGAPLAGHLKALVYDNFTGDAIPGAYVVAGTDIKTAIVKQTDNSGVAVLADASLTKPSTITIAGYCHSPITFVDDPVDTVTAYLDPILTPDCASGGDPPPVGGKSISVGQIQGELVWPMEGEFKKGTWKNIPPAVGPNERKAAYVFVVSGDPTQPFQMPDPTLGVHEDSPGDVGYGFTMYTLPGQRALYALAGIEDLSVTPPRFTAYVMGIARGVSVLPNQLSTGVLIPMKKTLDHTLTMTVSAPSPGPKGPDHLHATTSIMLGNDGFVILPIGQKNPLLPLQGDVDFVGVPNLDGDLSGATFWSTAKAATGPTHGAPLSAIGRILSNDTSQALSVNGFVGVPTLTTPADNAAWDTAHLATSFAQGGSPIDLVVFDVVSGNGLAHWLVAQPNVNATATLPDISGFPMASLIPGAIQIGVYGAHIEAFDYKKLRYRQLRPAGMSAYSLDFFHAHF